MTLRRWGLVIARAMVPVIVLAACARSPAPPPIRQVPAEALVSEASIRARCVDPEGVLAGRVFCVLRDAPSDQPARSP